MPSMASAEIGKHQCCHTARWQSSIFSEPLGKTAQRWKASMHMNRSGAVASRSTFRGNMQIRLIHSRKQVMICMQIQHLVAAMLSSVTHSSNAHISSRVQINFITRYGMRQHCFSSSEQYHDIMSWLHHIMPCLYLLKRAVTCDVAPVLSQHRKAWLSFLTM